MCTVVKKGAKPIKLRKDLTVYKVYRGLPSGRLISPYMEHIITTEKLLKAELAVAKQSYYESFFDQKQVDTVNKYINIERANGNKVEVDFIATGYHSAATANRLKNSICYSKEAIYLCTIPKGSLVYKGFSGLIVSNQIIVHNIIIKTK